LILPSFPIKVSFPFSWSGAEDFLLKFYSANKFKDPITGAKLKTFKSSDAAVAAAKKRSSGLLD